MGPFGKRYAASTGKRIISELAFQITQDIVSGCDDPKVAALFTDATDGWIAWLQQQVKDNTVDETSSDSEKSASGVPKLSKAKVKILSFISSFIRYEDLLNANDITALKSKIFELVNIILCDFQTCNPRCSTVYINGEVSLIKFNIFSLPYNYLISLYISNKLLLLYRHLTGVIRSTM